MSAAVAANSLVNNGAAVLAAAPDAPGSLPAVQPNAAPPFTYTLRMIPPPPGTSFTIPNMRLDAKGDFFANVASGDVLEGTLSLGAVVYHLASDSFEDVGGPSVAVAEDIGNNGFVVGTSQPVLGAPGKAFAWSKATGRLEIAGLGSAGEVITDSGLVGGDICSETECHAFQWDSSTSKRTDYDGFRLTFRGHRWAINNAGSMLGFVGGGVSPDQPAVLTRDGSVSHIQLPAACGPAFQPIAIDDEGDLFLELDPGHIVVLRDGNVTDIGRGAAVLPPGARDALKEDTAFIDINRKGGALLLDIIAFTDAAGNSRESAVGFHWSASSGASVIRLASASGTFPQSVNRDGIVVGTAKIANDRHAFVWTRESGAFDLETLVSDMPADRHLEQAFNVGDGGHVLARLDNFDLVLLTPIASPAVP
jgi:probable HAF family extracellular repeat protein